MSHRRCKYYCTNVRGGTSSCYSSRAQRIRQMPVKNRCFRLRWRGNSMGWYWSLVLWLSSPDQMQNISLFARSRVLQWARSSLLKGWLLEWAMWSLWLLFLHILATLAETKCSRRYVIFLARWLQKVGLHLHLVLQLNVNKTRLRDDYTCKLVEVNSLNFRKLSCKNS